MSRLILINIRLFFLWKRSPYEHNRSTQERDWDYRSFDPQVAWDKQLFYKIDPHLIMINPQTMEPQSVLYPGTPHPGGKIFLKLPLEKINTGPWVIID